MKRSLFFLTGFFLTALLFACHGHNPGPAMTEKEGRDQTDLTVYPLPPAPGKPLPRPIAGQPYADFESPLFAGAGRCAACHDNLIDEDGDDVSIGLHWRSTMMANAAKDPLWQAKVSSEVRRNPALRGVIEKKCATCHMPMALTQGIRDGIPAKILDKGFLDPHSGLHAPAMDGVSCTVCHQIQDNNLGMKAGFSGQFSIDIETRKPERLLYGPFEGPEQHTMQSSVGFIPVHGPQVLESDLCAICHTLYTPFVDAAGNVKGEFPEQTPFLEWRHSDYGKPADYRTCQNCHMPAADGPVILAKPAPAAVEGKEPFGRHHFVGGNIFMLNILRSNMRELGIAASSSRINDTRERTIRQLQEKTASLSITNLSKTNGALKIEVSVENMAGHKFPSGFPTRRAWLHCLVTDGTGGTLFESGKPLADGSISGNDGDNGLAYEPHYQTIDNPDQVQIYETILKDTEGKVTYTLLRAAGYSKDNRILPRGFDKLTAVKDIAVYGAAADDPDFIGGTDRLVYKMPLEGHPGPWTVTVELLYTPLSAGFIRDLNRDETREVDRFMRYYQEADMTPVVVAAVRRLIP